MTPARSPGRVPSNHRFAALAIIPALLVAVWGLWPLRAVPAAASPTENTAKPAAARLPAPLDLAAFRAPLWVAPPAPVQAAAPPAPPPPLRLQLIAIVHDGAGLRAAIYDPDSDCLRVVGPGETIAGRTVEQVRLTDLTLREGTRARTLALKSEGVAP